MNISFVFRIFKLLAVLVLLIPFHLLAQEEAWHEASASSKEYHIYRSKNTIPPFGLEKIKALVKTLSRDDEGVYPIKDIDYQKLSLREKFTYHMIYAENASQNCDAMPPIIDEDKKIFGQLPDAFEEASWSEKQEQFLIKNKDSVMALIKASVIRSKRVGLNYKQAIIVANGYQLIPFLVTTYKTDYKDHDLLTVLMLLLKKNKYKPFLEASSYIKLYGKKSNYLSYIAFNKANEELIISRAEAFYNGTIK